VIRLGIRVRAQDAEPAYARLLELLEPGAEERAGDGAVEWSLYGEPDALPEEARVRALAGRALLGITREPVAPGWARAFHAHLARIEAGTLAVRPPWVPGAPGDLVVDPGEAFGAGGHPTTRLALELLQAVPAAGALADWGTGTGVLALAAARLGFAPVVAVDADPAAVGLARANAAANALAIEVRTADLAQDAPWAPTIVANVPLPVHEAAAVARAPRTVLAAGFLREQADAAAAAWARRGLAEARRLERDGWAGLLLVADGAPA
jgi:ribosomal protein L11 methyltransferase